MQAECATLPPGGVSGEMHRTPSRCPTGVSGYGTGEEIVTMPSKDESGVQAREPILDYESRASVESGAASPGPGIKAAAACGLGGVAVVIGVMSLLALFSEWLRLTPDAEGMLMAVSGMLVASAAVAYLGGKISGRRAERRTRWLCAVLASPPTWVLLGVAPIAIVSATENMWGGVFVCLGFSILSLPLAFVGVWRGFREKWK